MKWHWFRDALLLAFFGCAGWAQQGQQNPAVAAEIDIQAARGRITTLSCLDAPAQAYSLYLPSDYSSERPWPIIYAFDPLARGKTAVEAYKEAAEKHGYIVAASNNSHNGPSADEFAAAQAMWKDTHRRFVIDKDRVYATGFSGGARMATSLALYCYTCGIAGVIAHGAGYPTSGSTKPANDHFAYYAAIGDEDFNFPEIMALREKKDAAGAPFKVKIYPGQHQWAPPSVVEDAIEWLELKAMQAGIKKVDPAGVQRLWEATKTEAEHSEQQGDALTQYYALRSLVEDFKGLEDTKLPAAQLASLKSSAPLKKARRNLENTLSEQASLAASTAGKLAEFGSADATTQIELGQQIRSSMLDLRRQAHSEHGDHLIYSRAFTQLWIQALEAGQDAFREHNGPSAAAYFQLLAEVSPDQGFPLLLLAETKVREGDKKAAIKALQEAVRRGVRRPETLTQDPELQPLASDPEFQRIVQSLGAQ